MGVNYTTLSPLSFQYIWNFLLKNKFKGAGPSCVVSFPYHWLEIKMTGANLESNCGGWQSHPTAPAWVLEQDLSTCLVDFLKEKLISHSFELLHCGVSDS